MTPRNSPTRPAAIRFDDSLSAADALLLDIERDPTLRSTIVSISLLDRRPDLERFERKLEHALAVIPRLRQRIVRDPLGIANPRWERDPHFDLRFHFRRSHLGGDGRVRDVLDCAAPIAMQAFDMERPLWELHLIEGLEGGRCAMLMKLHHAISDGVGLMRMTECLVERGPEDEELPPVAKEEAADPAPTDTWSRIGAAFARRIEETRKSVAAAGASAVSRAANLAIHPIDGARALGETVASVGRVLAPAAEPLSPLMRERSTRVRFDTLAVSLDELKRAGKSQRASVNDVFVAAVGGGLARYHGAKGAPIEALRMLMPVDVRAGDGANAAGNQFAPARFEVPVGIDDPALRIREIRRRSRLERDEPALPLVAPISAALGRLPTAAVTALFGAIQRTSDFTTSNVPGPRHATYMSGARVEATLPFGPLAGAAVNATVVSYDGAMYVGINSDPAAIDEPELLLESLRKSFDEVTAVVA